MKKIYIKSATAKEFMDIKLGDWIENVGTVTTYFEIEFIKNFGKALKTPEKLMKELKLQLQNIDDQIHLLQNKRQVIVNTIQSKECEHLRIRKGGGNSDYGYYPIWYECLDCGKIFNEYEIKQDKRETLEKNIVENTNR